MALMTMIHISLGRAMVRIIQLPPGGVTDTGFFSPLGGVETLKIDFSGDVLSQKPRKLNAQGAFGSSGVTKAKKEY